MNFADTVRIVTNIMLFFLEAVLAHFAIFAIIGIFAKRSYPKTDKKLRYGMIIPARNEESVVAGLIESIQKNRYPQDNLRIFVIAHNCSDDTARVAREAGAIVYEYNNPAENTMGYAFRYLFEQIDRDFGIKTFDGYFLFNADNILDKDYISRMNDAFVDCGGESVITSFRNSKNFGTNLISGLYGMYFTVGCRLESRGRTVAGCSTRVQGTGYLISSDIVENGWNYVTLAEDWEFSADRVLRGNNIRYCDDAIFYDEQPTSLRIMWRQRVRWSRGHLIVFYTRIKDLLRGIFGKGTKNRVSVYDITANVLPSTLLFLAIQCVQIILLLISPLIDPNCDLKSIFLGSSPGLFTSDGVLFGIIKGMIYSYITVFASSVLIFVIERKRIRKVSFLYKVLISLIWPIFLAIQVPMDVQAFFSRKLGWKPIPHNDTTTFEHVNR